MKETPVQQRVRLKAAYMLCQLWRNNTGACEDKTGRQIRYGLANDSAALNKRIKSSDLIGIVPVVITPDMVGKTIGVFGAFECKDSDWKFPAPTNIKEFERCTAQAAFHTIVRNAGGIAGFVTSEEDFVTLANSKR